MHLIYMAASCDNDIVIVQFQSLQVNRANARNKYFLEIPSRSLRECLSTNARYINSHRIVYMSRSCLSLSCSINATVFVNLYDMNKTFQITCEAFKCIYIKYVQNISRSKIIYEINRQAYIYISSISIFQNTMDYMLSYHVKRVIFAHNTDIVYIHTMKRKFKNIFLIRPLLHVCIYQQ